MLTQIVLIRLSGLETDRLTGWLTEKAVKVRGALVEWEHDVGVEVDIVKTRCV